MLTLIQYYFAYSNNRKQLSPFALIFSFLMLNYYYLKNLNIFINKLTIKIFRYLNKNSRILNHQFKFILIYFKVIETFLEDFYIYQKTNVCGDLLWLSFINNKELYKLYTI